MQSSLGFLLLGSLLLAGSVTAHNSKDKEKIEKLTVRSCGKYDGLVCIPTKCSRSACPLLVNAVCVDDRCGCDARFFNWIEKDKTYQEATLLCSSSNFVMNMTNFTTSLQNNDEGLKSALTYFKEFNLLVTQILRDIADYLKVATDASPTQDNIDRLRLAVQTLGFLKRAAREDDIQASNPTEKALLGGLIRSVVRAGIKYAANTLAEHANNNYDEDATENAGTPAVQNLEGRLFIGAILKAGAKLAGALLNNRNDVMTVTSNADQEIQPKYLPAALPALSKDKSSVAKVAPSSRPSGLQDEGSTIAKNFRATVNVLSDILDDEGSFADAVHSGSIAVSDDKVRQELKATLRAMELSPKEKILLKGSE